MKAVIICNGPSVENILKYKDVLNNSFIIACNRWLPIFKKLGLPRPHLVVIGKNSLEDNIKYINELRNNMEWTGVFSQSEFNSKSPKMLRKLVNYEPLRFGNIKGVQHYNSLWWSGFYSLQWAIQNGFEEIHIFGMTCNNYPDYNDVVYRAPIPQEKIELVKRQIKEIKEKVKSGVIKSKIVLYEPITHMFHSVV